MSVFDQLPKRKDGTTVTPFDDDWKHYTNIGRIHQKDDGHQIIFEPRLWRDDEEAKPRVWVFNDAEKTGEKVPGDLMLMFCKGGYKKHFDKLYSQIDKKYGIFTGSEYEIDG